MDDSHFDDLTRTLAVPSRRGLLSAIGTAILAALFGPESAAETSAKRNTRKHAKQKSHRHGRNGHHGHNGHHPAPGAPARFRRRGGRHQEEGKPQE